MSKFKDHTGDINYNTQGLKMTVIAYRGVRSIDVMFDNGYIVNNCTYSNFKSGSIKNYFYPTICGVGYIGINLKDEILRKTKSYKVWVDMIKRCYGKRINQAYKDCLVCDEWLCYANFKKWFDLNYYSINGMKMNLDKDIMVKGNKLYSPDTCIFVPQNINKLFLKNHKNRGILPIGIYHVSGYDTKYAVHFNSEGKLVNLGTFNTVQEAFAVYKTAKENEIKRVADEYKDKIPQKLYEAMYKYKVEITD